MHPGDLLHAGFAAFGLCLGGIAIAAAVTFVTAPITPRALAVQPVAAKPIGAVLGKHEPISGVPALYRY